MLWHSGIRGCAKFNKLCLEGVITGVLELQVGIKVVGECERYVEAIALAYYALRIK